MVKGQFNRIKCAIQTVHSLCLDKSHQGEHLLSSPPPPNTTIIPALEQVSHTLDGWLSQTSEKLTIACYTAATIESHLSMQCGLSSAIKLVSHTTKKNVPKTSNTPFQSTTPPGSTITLPPTGNFMMYILPLYSMNPIY
eukprot:9227051-Ditylum_brightwellii.AAC.1